MREGKLVERLRKPTSFGLVQATRERHLLCPRTDVFRSNAGGDWRHQATENARETDSNVGRSRAEPAAAQRRCNGFEGQRASGTCFRSHDKSASGANGDGDGNVSSKLQAHLATERRARQTGRCPAHGENRLCRGKPHGRRQGGKDLASDRGRCEALQTSVKHATPRGAG